MDPKITRIGAGAAQKPTQDAWDDPSSWPKPFEMPQSEFFGPRGATHAERKKWKDSGALEATAFLLQHFLGDDRDLVLPSHIEKLTAYVQHCLDYCDNSGPSDNIKHDLCPPYFGMTQGLNATADFIFRFWYTLTLKKKFAESDRVIVLEFRPFFKLTAQGSISFEDAAPVAEKDFSPMPRRIFGQAKKNATGQKAASVPLSADARMLLGEIPSALQPRGYTKRNHPEDPEAVKAAYRVINKYDEQRKKGHTFTDAELDLVRAARRTKMAERRYRQSLG